MPLLRDFQKFESLVKGFGPGETQALLPKYIEGSYAYDPMSGQESATIETRPGPNGQVAHLTLKGGPNGAKFRIDKFVGKIGDSIPAQTVYITVPANKTQTIGTGPINEPGASTSLPKGYQCAYKISLVDTFYKAPSPVTPTTQPATTESKPNNAQPPASEPTALTNSTTATPNTMDNFRAFMVKESIPRVPNYIPVTIVIGGIVAVIGVVATRKK
ncbi:Uncharacterised protein [uncultured archaeon]|nr:Uncharacterised protein [uncultured archaeon]